MKARPVLRYHGGKWLLARWIISHFGPHSAYVEPFGGAASVLLRKERSRIEVYNDLWGTVVNVFRVVCDREKARELARLLYLTPFAREEFNQATQSRMERLSDLDRARLTIVRSFAGFGSASTNGEHSTGFRSSNAKRSSFLVPQAMTEKARESFVFYALEHCAIVPLDKLDRLLTAARQIVHKWEECRKSTLTGKNKFLGALVPRTSPAAS